MMFIQLRKYLQNKLVLLSIIFIFSLTPRILTLNDMGQTWDETAYVLDGFKLVNHLWDLDFQHKDWYSWADHPPLSKYLYGISSLFDHDGYFKTGEPSFDFDYTAGGLLSAILFSLTVILTVLLGMRISKTVGIMSGIILSLLPISLGLSQLVSIESPLILFFTLSVYTFINLLEKFTLKRFIIAAFALGLAISVKYTNIFLFPILVLAHIFYVFFENKERKLSSFKPLLVIPVSILIFFLLWPALWFHLSDVIKSSSAIREAGNLQEFFMGNFSTSPIYFAVYFLTTTPLFIIIFFLIGLKDIRKKNFFILTLAVWFFLPFLQSFYFLRQGGIRYLIEIYVPLSIFAAIGINYLANKFKSLGFELIYVLIVIYLLISLFTVSPYYLNYFNILAGGTYGAYLNRTFPLGWWGEGQREAAIYVAQHAAYGARVGVFVVPSYLLPPIDGLTYEFYNQDKKYDFLIINYNALLYSKQDFSSIPKDYGLVYSVQAGSAPIVNVYKRIN